MNDSLSSWDGQPDIKIPCMSNFYPPLINVNSLELQNMAQTQSTSNFYGQKEYNQVEELLIVRKAKSLCREVECISIFEIRERGKIDREERPQGLEARI